VSRSATFKVERSWSLCGNVWSELNWNLFRKGNIANTPNTLVACGLCHRVCGILVKRSSSKVSPGSRRDSPRDQAETGDCSTGHSPITSTPGSSSYMIYISFFLVCQVQYICRNHQDERSQPRKGSRLQVWFGTQPTRPWHACLQLLPRVHCLSAAWSRVRRGSYLPPWTPARPLQRPRWPAGLEG